MLFLTSTSVYAHIDCNSFFAACEVLRNPALKGKCVCIGDQISIAASYEAKRFGIKTGTPMWEAERILGHRLIKILPDHTFYGEVSAQLMTFLKKRFGTIEPFSIDELFVPMTGLSDDYGVFAEEIKHEIRKVIGIPVSIGVSNTRLRAKMFGEFRKPFGSFVSFDTPEIETIFSHLPVRDIPYIARGNSERLGMHIRTVLDFYRLSPFHVQKTLGKNGVTLWLELHGVDVWRPHDVDKKRKSIISSRSFNHTITDNRHTLWQHCLENIERAYESLLGEKQAVRMIGVLLRTKSFENQWAWRDIGKATIDRAVIQQTIRELFQEAYDPDTLYRSTGIGFAELTPFIPRQLSLFDRENTRHSENEKLAEVISKLKGRFGKDVIGCGFIREKKEKEDIGVLMEAR